MPKAASCQGWSTTTLDFEPQMFPDRTPEELTAYVKRLEELAWRLVGDFEEYQALMEDTSMVHHTYIEALELLILAKSGEAD